MFDESKAIAAKDIVDEPEDIYGLIGAYIIIYDTSMTGTFRNLPDALNILYDKGWEVASMSTDTSGRTFVIMKNTQYKRKSRS